jgi:aspartyl-tRNA synthetase
MLKTIGSVGKFINKYSGIFSLLIISLILMNLFGLIDLGFERDSKINVSGVLKEIKQISQLDTVEMHFNEILDYRESIKISNIEIPFTEKKFIIVVKAKVQSGIDLSFLTEKDIQISDKKITLTLSNAKITSKEILEYNAYSESNGLFNKVSNEDTLKTLNEFRGRLEKQALDSGILKIAEDNAKVVLESFLRLLGFEEIVINFTK